MKTLRLYETIYRGNVAYQAQGNGFMIPIYLVWMENRDRLYALYESTYSKLEKFDEAGTIEEAKQKMQEALLRWATQFSLKSGVQLEKRIYPNSIRTQ